MTGRLDEVKKYIELFKKSDSASKEYEYWSEALNILKVVDATVKEEEVEELESLENEMISAFYNSTEIGEFRRRKNHFY